MAKPFHNADGSQYCAETIIEIIASAFKDSRNGFPAIDFGSDWGANYPAPRSSDDYIDIVIRHVNRVFVDDSGHFNRACFDDAFDNS